MTSRLAIGFACLSAALSLVTAPLRAHAGGALITGHELQITLKGAAQGESNSGEGTADKGTLKDKDIFELCTGESPTKDQGVFLFLDCGNLNNNEIDAIGTNPLTGLAEVGSISFDVDHPVETTKNGNTKSIKIPVTIELTCGAGTLDVELNGIMNIKYSDLAKTTCPDSASVKVTGVGDSNSKTLPPAFLLDDGSSVKAKKRDGAIAGFPIIP